MQQMHSEKPTRLKARKARDKMDAALSPRSTREGKFRGHGDK
jgi:hypothetical protein